jgi:hypothetical protein
LYLPCCCPLLLPPELLDFLLLHIRSWQGLAPATSPLALGMVFLSSPSYPLLDLCTVCCKRRGIARWQGRGLRIKRVALAASEPAVLQRQLIANRVGRGPPLAKRLLAHEKIQEARCRGPF